MTQTLNKCCINNEKIIDASAKIEISFFYLFQSNQSKSNRRFFLTIDCFSCPPKHHVIVEECRKKHGTKELYPSSQVEKSKHEELINMGEISHKK